MVVQVVVLNGASSSGKTTLARALQDVLTETWLRTGVDMLLEMAPPRVERALIGSDGSVDADVPEFRAAEQVWMDAVAFLVQSGSRVVLDEVFLSGRAGADRWKQALPGVPILWIGVHCAPEETVRRERARPDRVPGMAALQAGLVHRGMTYDLEVDTTSTPPEELARQIAALIER